jgi:hypothetical protein
MKIDIRYVLGFVLVVVLIFWYLLANSYFEKDIVCSTSTNAKDNNVTNKVQTDWKCNCKKTCPQMSSCEEAYYQLNQCGCSIRDGDGDGVPCENIC